MGVPTAIRLKGSLPTCPPGSTTTSDSDCWVPHETTRGPLKPRGRSSHRVNVYDVVESLAGAGEGTNLRSLAVAPQRVRSEHFHRGELLDDELGDLMIADPFVDPSFDGMLRKLSTTTRVCLIEWLRCKGDYSVVRIPRDKPRSAWLRAASDVLRWLRALPRR